MREIPEVVADQPEAVKESFPPKLRDHWIVLALWSEPNGCWHQPRTTGLYISREAAQKAAKELSSRWTHRRIVRIPGEP